TGLDGRQRRRIEDERGRAREDAEAGSRAKDEFFAMLGHELRNPLGAITAALGVIGRARRLDDNDAQAREIISRQVGYLVRQVDDLLDVARMTTGKIALDRRPLSLTGAARRATAAVSAAPPGPAPQSPPPAHP